MNNTWHEKIAGSLFADETGKVIDEVVNPFNYPFAGFVAKVEGEIIGSYISAATARIAVELFIQHQVPGRTVTIEPLVYDDPGENKIRGHRPEFLICDDFGSPNDHPESH
jgi:hypothetical protein